MIHIFSNGNIQLRTSEIDETKQNVQLENLEDFLFNLTSLRPNNITISDYDVINIFDDDKIQYIGKEIEKDVYGSSYSIKYDDMDPVVLNNFIDEVIYNFN